MIAPKLANRTDRMRPARPRPTDMSAPFRLDPGLDGLVLPGGFRLEQAVAEGASGTVVRAEQESLRRKVAVKISHAADEQAVARARREARIVAALDAPGIVRVFASGELADGRAWVAMEWIDGTTLEDALEHGPLSVPRALAIAAQIARALDHAHRAGVVHRDLKPANVMLRSGDRVVVVDFGIARAAAIGPGGSASRMAGTPHYMAPEQASGDELDDRVDLYALGGVLYRMLAGRVPFAGSAIEVMLAHLHNDPPALPSSVPPEVAAIVRGLLAKRPEDRPGPAGALAEELDRMASAAWLRAGQVDPAAATFAALTITPPASVAPRGRWRGRVIAAGALAAVIAVTVAVGIDRGGNGAAMVAGSGAGGADAGVVGDAGLDLARVTSAGTAIPIPELEPAVALVVDGGWAMRATRPRAAVAGRTTTVALEIWDGDGEPARAGTLAITVREPDGSTRPADVAGRDGRFLLRLAPRLAGPHVVTVFAPAGETTLAVAIEVGPAPP